MVEAAALPPGAVIQKLWVSFKTNKFGREVLMTTQGHCELGRPQSLQLCRLGFKNDLCWSKFKQKLVGISLTVTCWQLLRLQEPLLPGLRMALPPSWAAIPPWSKALAQGS